MGGFFHKLRRKPDENVNRCSIRTVHPRLCEGSATLPLSRIRSSLKARSSRSIAMHERRVAATWSVMGELIYGVRAVAATLRDPRASYVEAFGPRCC